MKPVNLDLYCFQNLLLVLIFMFQSTIFQSCKDGSSWVEPVRLNKAEDKVSCSRIQSSDSAGGEKNFIQADNGEAIFLMSNTGPTFWKADKIWQILLQEI